MTPLFSVIVTTYERQAMLDEAIASVLGQTVDDLELIVVDDASPTSARVPADPRVRLVRHAANRGEPAARNTGLGEARGRSVAFLDDDDRWTPDRLDIALEGLRRAPVAVCFRQELGAVEPGGNRMLEGDVADVILDAMTPQMGQIAVERERTPRFDERYAALTDVEWWFRVSRETSVATVPRVGLLYRTHRGPRNRNGLEHRVRCSMMLLEQYADWFAAHPRAAAFRWRRIGIMATRLGQRPLARRALVRSMRLRPAPATVAHLVRAMRPGAPTEVTA